VGESKKDISRQSLDIVWFKKKKKIYILSAQQLRFDKGKVLFVISTSWARLALCLCHFHDDFSHVHLKKHFDFEYVIGYFRR
jgi:hypothetical protein